jgi:predicted negative regulator of RcsB-dependent stress response
VDEFLTDEEQVDRVRQWWRENGWFLIGGVALGGLLLFGWNQYQTYQERQAEQAAALYESVKQATEADNSTEATALLGRLRAEHAGSAYTHQAGLLVARSTLITSPERAAEDLRYVMEHSDDAEFAMIARLRLARVLVYREQYQQALDLLDVATPGEFTGRINEIRGDIHVARGDTAAARAAYIAAMFGDGSEVLDRNYLQMKLNDLTSASGDTARAVPGESTASPPAAPLVAPEPAPTPQVDEGA